MKNINLDVCIAKILKKNHFPTFWELFLEIFLLKITDKQLGDAAYLKENLFKIKKRLHLGVCIEKYCLFLSDRK